MEREDLLGIRDRMSKDNYAAFGSLESEWDFYEAIKVPNSASLYMREVMQMLEDLVKEIMKLRTPPAKEAVFNMKWAKDHMITSLMKASAPPSPMHHDVQKVWENFSRKKSTRTHWELGQYLVELLAVTEKLRTHDAQKHLLSALRSLDYAREYVNRAIMRQEWIIEVPDWTYTDIDMAVEELPIPEGLRMQLREFTKGEPFMGPTGYVRDPYATVAVATVQVSGDYRLLARSLERLHDSRVEAVKAQRHVTRDGFPLDLRAAIGKMQVPFDTVCVPAYMHDMLRRYREILGVITREAELAAKAWNRSRDAFSGWRHAAQYLKHSMDFAIQASLLRDSRDRELVKLVKELLAAASNTKDLEDMLRLVTKQYHPDPKAIFTAAGVELDDLPRFSTDPTRTRDYGRVLSYDDRDVLVESHGMFMRLARFDYTPKSHASSSV